MSFSRIDPSQPRLPAGGSLLRALAGAVLLALLAGCASTPPGNPNDLCAIFKEKPRWFRAAKKSETRWGVPSSVMMAVMYKESSYIADAKPPRTKLLWVIPWKRESDAVGFAQATDAAWKDYLKATGNRFAERDDFADAVDFVGWYMNTAHRRAGIAVTDARSLYLSYYSGITGYMRGTWKNNDWLKGAADKVATRSTRYAGQMRRCRVG